MDGFCGNCGKDGMIKSVMPLCYDCAELLESAKKAKKSMTAAQKELARKHGTPEQFEGAVYKAYLYLMITQAEMSAGIIKYRDEWKKAGRRYKQEKTHDDRKVEQ